MPDTEYKLLRLNEDINLKNGSEGSSFLGNTACFL